MGAAISMAGPKQLDTLETNSFIIQRNPWGFANGLYSLVPRAAFEMEKRLKKQGVPYESGSKFYQKIMVPLLEFRQLIANSMSLAGQSYSIELQIIKMISELILALREQSIDIIMFQYPHFENPEIQKINKDLLAVMHWINERWYALTRHLDAIYQEEIAFQKLEYLELLLQIKLIDKQQKVMILLFIHDFESKHAEQRIKELEAIIFKLNGEKKALLIDLGYKYINVMKKSIDLSDQNRTIKLNIPGIKKEIEINFNKAAGYGLEQVSRRIAEGRVSLTNGSLKEAFNSVLSDHVKAINPMVAKNFEGKNIPVDCSSKFFDGNCYDPFLSNYAYSIERARKVNNRISVSDKEISFEKRVLMQMESMC